MSTRSDPSKDAIVFARRFSSSSRRDAGRTAPHRPPATGRRRDSLRWRGPRYPPAPMGKRTPSDADLAYERVREICLTFPAVDEKLSHGAPSFFVRKGKMFLTFVDDHHGDGRIAVWCKSTLAEHKKLVAGDPTRFVVPPYVGVGGWVGVRVDGPDPDWIDLSILVEEGWRAVAPPRVARGEAVPPAKPILPPPSRVTTDEKV